MAESRLISGEELAAGCKIIVLSTYGFRIVWPFPKDIINQANKGGPPKHTLSHSHSHSRTPAHMALIGVTTNIRMTDNFQFEAYSCFARERKTVDQLMRHDQ